MYVVMQFSSSRGALLAMRAHGPVGTFELACALSDELTNGDLTCTIVELIEPREAYRPIPWAGKIPKLAKRDWKNCKFETCNLAQTCQATTANDCQSLR